MDDVKLIKLPTNVNYIIHKLQSNGYVAYVVGGCVRDSLMGNLPNDWDICTSATPEEVMEVFNENQIIPTGLKHGTVSVMVGNELFEVTTFRKDADYSDGRHPDNVTYVNSLIEDLKRRDFTINAIAYNDEEGLIDPLGGIADIEKRIIRCVGNPNDRFSEDALRILRAFRFAIRFNFDIDSDTLCTMLKLQDTLNNVSIERVNAELTSTLEKSYLPNIDVEKLFSMLLMIERRVKIPFHSIHDRLHILQNLNSPINIKYALTILFYNTDIMQVLKNLRYSTGICNSCAELVKYCKEMYFNIEFVSEKYLDSYKIILKSIMRQLKYVDIDDVLNVLAVMYRGGDCINTFNRINYCRELVHAIKDNHEPYLLKHLAINGDKLLELGISPKDCGEILNKLLVHVIMNGHNTEPELVQFVVDKLERHRITT